jgi:hypothetical protein
VTVGVLAEKKFLLACPSPCQKTDRAVLFLIDFTGNNKNAARLFL